MRHETFFCLRNFSHNARWASKKEKSINSFETLFAFIFFYLFRRSQKEAEKHTIHTIRFFLCLFVICLRTIIIIWRDDVCELVPSSLPTLKSNKIHRLPHQQWNDLVCVRVECWPTNLINMAWLHSSLANHALFFQFILIRIEVRNEYMVERITVFVVRLKCMGIKQNRNERRKKKTHWPFHTLNHQFVHVPFRVSKQKCMEMLKSLDGLHWPASCQWVKLMMPHR